MTTENNGHSNDEANTSETPSPPGTVEVRGAIDRYQVVSGNEIQVKLTVSNTVQNRMALAQMDDVPGVNIIGVQLDLEALATRQDEKEEVSDAEWEDPNQTRLPVDDEAEALSVAG